MLYFSSQVQKKIRELRLFLFNCFSFKKVDLKKDVFYKIAEQLETNTLKKDVDGPQNKGGPAEKLTTKDKNKEKNKGCC